MPDTTQPTAPIRSVRISDEWREKLLAAGFPPEELCLGVAEEILRRLPKNITIDDLRTILVCFPEDKEWKVAYEVLPCELDDAGYLFHARKADTLANAAAAMYRHLAENKLLA